MANLERVFRLRSDEREFNKAQRETLDSVMDPLLSAFLRADFTVATEYTHTNALYLVLEKDARSQKFHIACHCKPEKDSTLLHVTTVKPKWYELDTKESFSPFCDDKGRIKFLEAYVDKIASHMVHQLAESKPGQKKDATVSPTAR